MATDSSADSGRPCFSLESLSLNGKNIFSSILNTLEEPFFLLDDTFRLYWYNKACNHLYRAVSAVDIGPGFDFNVLLTAEQQGAFQEHLNRVAAGENVHFDWKYQMTVVKWLSVSLYPFLSADGEFAGVCGSMRDITDKKITEQVLLRNTAVLNNIGEGVLLVDAQFRILTFNRRAIQLYGLWGSEPHIGANILSLIPENRRADVRRYLQRALGGVHVEYEIAYPDGLWLFISYLPLRNAAGSIEQISVSFRDISERKNTEEEMKANEIKYRALVESLSEGVILQTIDRQVLTANKSALDILGLDAAELSNGGFPSPDMVFVDEQEREIGRQNFLFRKNGQIHGVHNKIVGVRRPDGIQWLKLNSAVVVDVREAEPYTIVISFEDITRQKKISGEMEILALLARETVNAVIILHPNGEMLWMNEGFSRLTGYSAEELIGKSSRTFLLGPETDMNTVARAAHCRQHGLPFQEEFNIYTKAGKKVCTRVQGQAIGKSIGGAPNYFLFITDVTEEKKIEEERRRVILETQEVERNLLGRELHDNINQLLAAIRLQLSYSLETFPDCKPVLVQCRDNLIEAMEEIRYLSHQMVMPRFSERTLPQMLQSLADNYQYAQPIRLDSTKWQDDKAPVPVKEIFYRVAQEQLSNIYKHAKATQVIIRIASWSDSAALSIEDDGIGFSPAEKTGGIGLSNICSRVESQDGACRIISAPGQGCTLLVDIPLNGG